MLNDVLLNSYHFINFSGNKHSWTPTKLLLNDLEGIKKIITCEWKVCNEIWPATVSSFVCAQLVNPGATDETLSPCVNKTVCAAASPLWHTQPQCVTAVVTEIILCIKHDTYIKYIHASWFARGMALYTCVFIEWFRITLNRTTRLSE